jgi:hypothetical protein
MNAPRFRQSDEATLMLIFGQRFSLLPRFKSTENTRVVRWLGVTVVWRKR